MVRRSLTLGWNLAPLAVIKARALALCVSSSWAMAGGLLLAQVAVGQEQVSEVQAEGAPLALSDAIARAGQTSSRVRAAEAERNAQTEKRRSSFSDLGPRVSAAYNEAHYNEAQTASFGPGTPALLMRPEVARSGGLTVAQPITGLWGLSEKAAYESVQLDVKDIGLKLARGDVAFQAAETWLKAYNADRQLQIAEASVAAAESQRRDALALERAGRMNHGDVLKLELAVSEAKARVAQTRAVRDTVFAALKVAIGVPVSAPLVLGKTLPGLSFEVPEPLAAVGEALQKRLESQQAQAGVKAAGFYKKLAYTNFTPSVNLFWKWDHTFGELSALAGQRDTKYYGVQATWDLWNNGSHVFQVREAAENQVRAEELAKGVDESIRLDVLQAVASLRAAKESLSLAQAAVSQAEEAYRIEQARFRTGSRSATDLILAETSQASARGRLVTAETDLVLWHLKTEKALGADQPKL